jgi:hypothetical protein
MHDIVETPFTEALLDWIEKPMSVSDALSSIERDIDDAWDEFLAMVSDLKLVPVGTDDDDLPF